jgi:hypothetical protein
MDLIPVRETDSLFAGLRRRLRRSWLVVLCAILPAVAGAGTIVTGLGAGAPADRRCLR